jgi:hypothetical protein
MDKIKDPIVENVVKNFINRSNVGIIKYKTTLNDSNLSFDKWVNHTQEELMDAVNYLEKIKMVCNTYKKYEPSPQTFSKWFNEFLFELYRFFLYYFFIKFFF